MRRTLVLSSAVLLAACGDSPTTPPVTPPVIPPVVQVGNAGIYVTTVSNSVLVFPLTATGNVAPTRTISGSNTGLSLPIGIGVDSHGSVYVANRTGSKVTVYPLGANGNIAPTRTLTDTAMKSPQVLFIDRADNVLVATCPNCGSAAGGATAMFQFANGASVSNSVIRGANTGLTVPAGINADAAGNIFISNAFGGSVNVYAPGASGNALPIRSFNPGASNNIQSSFVAVNSIFLGAPGGGLLVYPINAGPGASPAATIQGSATLPLNYPGGVYVDASVAQPVIYLVDYGAGAIYVIQTAGTAPNLTVRSVETIKGALTGLNSPLGITVVH